MSVGDLIRKEIDGKVQSGLTMTNSMNNMRETTISGYRSTHASQVFRFGLASSNIYVIGDSDNYMVQ